MAATKPVKAEIIERVTQIVEHSGRPEGIEPVEVSFAGSGSQRLLRIYIDKPGGVTHGDCEAISRRVSDVLDAEDVIPGASYTLEVSSPGVERKLGKPADFVRYTGQKIRVVLREPVESRTLWDGVLTSFSEDHTITLTPAQGEPVQFQLDQVSRANLKFEW